MQRIRAPPLPVSRLTHSTVTITAIRAANRQLAMWNGRKCVLLPHYILQVWTSSNCITIHEQRSFTGHDKLSIWELPQTTSTTLHCTLLFTILTPFDAMQKDRMVTQLNKLHLYMGKGKGSVHPRTGHEGPEGGQMYSSTLPSISALDGGRWSTPRPGRCTPGKDPVPNV